MSGWAVEDLGNEVHVRPLNDLVAHEPDDCVCGPTIEFSDPETGEYHRPLVTHHSLDGREATEGQDRPPGASLSSQMQEVASQCQILAQEVFRAAEPLLERFVSFLERHLTSPRRGG